MKKSEEEKTNKKLTDLSNALGIAKGKIEELEGFVQELERLNKLRTRVDAELWEAKIGIRTKEGILEKERANLENTSKKKVSVEDDRIDEYESQRTEIAERKAVLLHKRELLQSTMVLLKDSGIKAEITRHYIPVINKTVNEYLSALDFFVEFQLDENFQEKILSRHRDEFTYSSFSEGEKKRIDLAFLFTWRAISKLRNSVSCNLLILDEILDSSLDEEGTDEFLRLLAKLTSDTSVIIISHKGDQLQERFDRVIKFEKVKGFSRMEKNG